MTRAPNGSSAQRGVAVIEFALVALVLYLLIGAMTTFGTMVHTAQVAQDVARLAARELALTPLPPVMTFEQALGATDDRLFDPNQLVIDLDALTARNETIDSYFATLPLVNRALRPVFVFDQVGDLRLLRFPGALLISPAPTIYNAGLTVGVPRVVDRFDGGGEAIEWLPIIEEIRPDPRAPSSGPFSAAAAGADRGLVALRVNIPAVSSMLAEYDAPVTWPPPPNAGQPHRAGPVTTVPGFGPTYGTPIAGSINVGPTPISGEQGLGELLAFGTTVRPFRRVFIGQAIFRREVYQQ